MPTRSALAPRGDAGERPARCSAADAALLHEAEAQRALAALFPHLEPDALRAIQALFPLARRRHPAAPEPVSPWD